MTSLASLLGLDHSATGPNHAPAYLCYHFVYAYCVLASRTPKQIIGIDHQVSPRYDLAKYGDDAVRSGKITRRQLEMIQRCESASANAVENYTLFVGAVCAATFSGVDRRLVNRAGFIYTVARTMYGPIYVFIDHPKWSVIRGVVWWIGNASCLYLLWKASEKLKA